MSLSKLLYIRECLDNLVLPATRHNLEYAMRAQAMIDALVNENQNKKEDEKEDEEKK